MPNEEYVPYTGEWRKEISKLPKAIIVTMFSKLGQRKDALKYEGVLIGLEICKEMFAQGQISHENIYENELYYKELLESELSKIAE